MLRVEAVTRSGLYRYEMAKAIVAKGLVAVLADGKRTKSAEVFREMGLHLPEEPVLTLVLFKNEVLEYGLIRSPDGEEEAHVMSEWFIRTEE
jgi:hypothetical protein